MKKVSPKMGLLVGLLVLIIAMSSGAYAWFRALDTGTADKVTAGKIDLEGNQSCKIIIDDILPGEAVDLTGSTVNYTGNRKALIRFSVGSVAGYNGLTTRARILTQPLGSNKDWLALSPAIKATDYEVVAGFNSYTDKRFHEIVGLKNLSGAADVYEGSDGSFYMMVEPTEVRNLAMLTTIVFKGEFGGLYDDGSGNLSPSRQFEQESRFYNIAIQIEAVQITEAAVEEVWGTDSLNAVKGLPIYGQIQAESTWGL